MTYQLIKRQRTKRQRTHPVWCVLTLITLAICGCDQTDLESREVGVKGEVNLLSAEERAKLGDRLVWRWPSADEDSDEDSHEVLPEDHLNQSPPLFSQGGLLQLNISPKRESPHSAVQVSVHQTELPRDAHILLPTLDLISGTVSSPPDDTVESSPLLVEGWLTTRDQGELVTIYPDRDPFSRAQLLFEGSLYTSDLSGALRSLERELYVRPLSLPPLKFNEVNSGRFSLDAPPESTLEVISCVVWLDPDARISAGVTSLSLWRNDEPLSRVVESDVNGRANLSYWRSAIDALAPEDELILRASPREATLPMLEHRISVAELAERSSADEALELIYPRLSSATRVPIRVSVAELSEREEANSTENDPLWRITLIQAWGALEERSQSSPTPITRQRSSALWRDDILARADTPSELTMYQRDGVLFVSPEPNSRFSTQRIELTNTAEQRGSIQLIARLKPNVKGQVHSSESGENLRARLRFKQLAWPWIDASTLPLNEWVVETDPDGRFAINLDPGVYAMTLMAEITYAPRVTLISVPETEGVLLSPDEVDVSRGEMTTLTIGAQGDSISPIASRYTLVCLIASESEIFQGTSLRSLSTSKISVFLTRGQLEAGEVGVLRLDEQSCPALTETD